MTSASEQLPRMVRACVTCGGRDSEPWWHVHIGEGGGITWKHMDCCAKDGCPSSGEHSCDHALRQGGGERGDALRDFLHGRAGI